MTFEQMIALEKQRVARLVESAVGELETEGNIKVFSFALMMAAVQLYGELEGDEALAEMLTRIGMNELKRKGLNPC